jgi:hypothetical protein
MWLVRRNRLTAARRLEFGSLLANKICNLFRLQRRPVWLLGSKTLGEKSPSIAKVITSRALRVAGYLIEVMIKIR